MAEMPNTIYCTIRMKGVLRFRLWCWVAKKGLKGMKSIRVEVVE